MVRLIVPESSHMLMLTRIVQISEFNPSFYRIKSLSTHQHSLHDAHNHAKIRCEKFRSISLKAFYLINIRCMTHLIAQISDGLNSFRLTRYFFISTPFITSPGSRCSKILNQVHSLPPSEMARSQFLPKVGAKARGVQQRRSFSQVAKSKDSSGLFHEETGALIVHRKVGTLI